MAGAVVGADLDGNIHLSLGTLDAWPAEETGQDYIGNKLVLGYWDSQI